MSVLNEALSKAGKEFGEIKSHAIMDMFLEKSTCFVCDDDNDNHNKCRNRACHAQLVRRRKL